MAFLSASKDTKSEEPRFAEATHVFCTHFDPLHGST